MGYESVVRMKILFMIDNFVYGSRKYFKTFLIDGTTHWKLPKYGIHTARMFRFKFFFLNHETPHSWTLLYVPEWAPLFVRHSNISLELKELRGCLVIFFFFFCKIVLTNQILLSGCRQSVMAKKTLHCMPHDVKYTCIFSILFNP